MGILDKMFNWFTAKDKDGNEMNLGFMLDGEPKTIQDIEKVFRAFKLDNYFDTIKPLVRPKIDLFLTPTDEPKFGTAISKIGGQPHLPKDYDWPKNELGKSLSFIGQLNFGSFKVFYFEKISELAKHTFPTDLEQHSIFKPNNLTFSSSLSLPTWEDDSIEGLIEDKDSDNYAEVSSGSDNQVLVTQIAYRHRWN
jgi:hypothetical protein